MKFAFFDFDNTLFPGDSILSFMRFCHKRKLFSFSHWIRCAFSYLMGAIKPQGFIYTKKISLSFLKNRSEAQISSVCHDYIHEYINPRIFTEARNEIMDLKNKDYVIVIVSASTSCYMDLLPQILPVDAVLCTRMVYSNDVFTGSFENNCKGNEKVFRIRNYLELLGIQDKICEKRGYGDSESDIPMLSYVDFPFLVSPSVKIKKRYPDIPVKNWKE